MTSLRGVLPYCEATTVVKHCGVSAGAVQRKVVDAKELFEYTRGVLCAYVNPAHSGSVQGFGRGGAVVCAAQVTHSSDIVDVPDDVLVKGRSHS